MKQLLAISAFAFFIALAVPVEAAPLNFSNSTQALLTSPSTTFTIRAGSVADSLTVNATSVAVALSSSTAGSFTLTSPSYDLTIASSSSGGTASLSCVSGVAETTISQQTGQATYTIAPIVAQPIVASVTGSNLVGMEGIFVDSSTQRAYVVGDGSPPGPSMSIYDISNPSSPSLLGTVGNYQLYTVNVAGHYAYLGGHDGTFRIVDVSNPSSSTLTGSVTSTDLAAAEGETIIGSHAYVVGLNNTFASVDISNPHAPTAIGGFVDNVALNQPFQIAGSGNSVYVAACGTDDPSGRFTVVDVSSPASPSVAASINITGCPDAIAISGNRAYVGSYNSNSLTVVDISNPLSPTILGSVSDPQFNGPTSFTISGSRVYSVGTNSDPGNLTVVDVSNSAHPVVVANIVDTRLNAASAVNVLGNFAYIPAGFFADPSAANALTVIDTQKLLASTQCTAPSNNGGGSGGSGVSIGVASQYGIPNFGGWSPHSAALSPTPPASSTIAPSSSALITQLTALKAELAVLLAQAGQAGSSPAIIPFTRNLSLGMTGNDVTALQDFLINQASGPAATRLKAHGVTNTFGPLTFNALKEFQKKVGIRPVSGYFGPKTRARANAMEETIPATNR